MKVCTDSCLFGAWVASTIQKEEITPKTVMDIGAGSGLLSMMLAQKIDCSIDAIEIDEQAFLQCAQNFRDCAWSERLNPFLADIKSWEAPRKYDLIISNPPFFENDLLPLNMRKSISKHSRNLSLNELLSISSDMLNGDGKLAVLLPFRRSGLFENVAYSLGLFVEQRLDLKQTDKHDYFRTILFFGKKNVSAKKKRIIIKNNDKEYSEEFVALLKDYYLYL